MLISGKRAIDTSQSLPHGSDADIIAAQVYAEQVDLLYRQLPLTALVTVINGAILVFVQRTQIAHSSLAIWYCALLLIVCLRLLLYAGYLKRSPQPEQARFWLRWFLSGVALAGLTWGASAIFLFPANSVSHQVFVAFVLAGMSAASTTVLASSQQACLLFLVPALVPLAIQWFRQVGDLPSAMGVMTVIFLFGLLFSANTIHRAITTSLQLRFGNQMLQQEIDQRRETEEALDREKDRLQITLAAINEGVVITDARARIVYMNPAARQLSEAGGEQLLQEPMGLVFKVFDEQTLQIKAVAAERCIEEGSQVLQSGLLRPADGEQCFVELVASPLYSRHGTPIGSVCVFHDVTASRAQTAQLVYEAQHDSLTGLPNRNLLNDRLSQTVERARRSGQQFALLFIDLDWFKEVNDEHGHDAGDALLVQLAARLAAVVRAEDTVARLGGDEFVVIVEHLQDKAVITTIANKILHTLSQPFILPDCRAKISASIGISVFSDKAMDAKTLLSNADKAAYCAKARGRNQACFYTPS